MVKNYKPLQKQSNGKGLKAAILIMSILVGGVGSSVLTLVATNKAWMIMALVALAVLDGYLIGSISKKNGK